MNTSGERAMLMGALMASAMLATTFSESIHPPIRIMPVGDSITRGSYLVSSGLPNPMGGGWRKSLQDKLRAAGVSFEFVGELEYHAYGTNGVVDPSFSPRHHGLAGFSNKGILEGGPVPTPRDVLAARGVKGFHVPGIAEALRRNAPDVVLLMSGANGFDAAARDRLIQTIAENFKGELFVASIPPQKPPRPGWEKVTDYNASLPARVEAMMAKGVAIHYVNMNAALTADDISADGVHPTAAGMEKIAATWFGALRSAGLAGGQTR